MQRCTDASCDRFYVYYGTIFFPDLHKPANRNGDNELRFAEDLSISKQNSSTTANGDVLTDVRCSQANIHAWVKVTG